MKKTFCLLMVTLIMLITFSILASAENKFDDYNLSVDDLSDDFITITKDNISKNEEFLTSIGFTVNSFKELFTKNELLYFAADKENSLQVQIKVSETNFSSEIKNLSDLSDEGISDIADTVTDSEHEIVTFNKIKYFLISTDNSSDYITRQYITISNGKLFTISFYATKKSLTDKNADDIENIMFSVHFEKSTSNEKTFKSVFNIILVSILILIAFGTAVYSAVTIIKDVKKDEDDLGVIKHRKK